MNRRDFIKKSALATGITAFASGMTLESFSTEPTISDDLKDLYAYLESHTIWHPLRGKVPFKLYPHQKEILKNIHENDKVVIVKARQIGMTTLLAGYTQWKAGLDRYDSGNNGLNENFARLTTQFHRNKTKIDPRYCWIFDEYNYVGHPFPYVDVEKLIITGTPDPSGNLKWAIDRKDELGLKVFTYSAYDCSPMWDKERIDDAKNILSEKVFQREIEAKFV